VASSYKKKKKKKKKEGLKKKSPILYPFEKITRRFIFCQLPKEGEEKRPIL
jgi:hypothetical protein